MPAYHLDAMLPRHAASAHLESSCSVTMLDAQRSHKTSVHTAQHRTKYGLLGKYGTVAAAHTQPTRLGHPWSHEQRDTLRSSANQVPVAKLRVSLGPNFFVDARPLYPPSL